MRHYVSFDLLMNFLHAFSHFPLLLLMSNAEKFQKKFKYCLEQWQKKEREIKGKFMIILIRRGGNLWCEKREKRKSGIKTYKVDGWKKKVEVSFTFVSKR